MDLTALTPAQIDELWAPINDRLLAADEVLRAANKRAGRLPAGSRLGITAWDAAQAARQARDAIVAEAAPFRAEWDRRKGWTRAYLVLDGHVHRHTHCHTLRPRTQIVWLPEVSGKDEAEIVELAGERACTVCYPSAPVDRPTQLFLPEERKSMAEKAQRAAELAAKKAATQAKSIRDIDGNLLRDSNGFVIKTERTAEIEAVNEMHNHLAYEYSFNAQVFMRIVAALAHKRGEEYSVTEAFIIAKAEKKAAKTKREIEKMRQA